MQPITEILDDEQWSKLVQDAAFLFDDLTLKRGFQYYKQKRVRPFTLTESRKLLTLVEGMEDYSVMIDLDNLGHSRCECPVKGPCKHMAAVLMNYADMANRSVQMIANAKAAASLQTTAGSKTGSATEAKLARQSLLQKHSSQLPEGGLTAWREYCIACSSPVAQSIRTPGYPEKAMAVITTYKPSMSPAADKLFQLYTHLFLLEMLTRPQGPAYSTVSSSLGYFTHLSVAEQLQSIEQLLAQPLPLRAEPEQWPRAKELLADLRQHMLSEARGRLRERPYFSMTYQLFWDNWLTPNMDDSSLYEEELHSLRAAEDQWGTSLSRHSWLLAQSRMHLYLREDDEAWERLRTAADSPALQPEELLSILEPLARAQDWDRLISWLVKTGQLLSSRIYVNLDDYSAYWDQALAQRPEAEDVMWKSLKSMLPLAADIYSEKLLAHEQWQAWMDYQLTQNKGPADFRVKMLQPLEKHAPETLLPFYHQAVERYVREKNRQSYKAAVKLLKRLAKLYKKLKREERWEQYLELFTTRHSRLRALQEELRKGNLMS